VGRCWGVGMGDVCAVELGGSGAVGWGWQFFVVFMDTGCLYDFSNILTPLRLSARATSVTGRCGLFFCITPPLRNMLFQYVDWLIEGKGLIAVSRTAYDDGMGGGAQPA
jgi:hypothetical protein